MAVALAKPEPEKGKRNDLLNNSTGLDFDKASLSRARFVLRHCRDKAEEVLRNAKYPLTVAYEEAQAIVEEQRLAEEERQLAANLHRSVNLIEAPSINAALELLSAPRARG